MSQKHAVLVAYLALALSVMSVAKTFISQTHPRTTGTAPDKQDGNPDQPTGSVPLEQVRHEIQELKQRVAAAERDQHPAPQTGQVPGRFVPQALWDAAEYKNDKELSTAFFRELGNAYLSIEERGGKWNEEKRSTALVQAATLFLGLDKTQADRFEKASRAALGVVQQRKQAGVPLSDAELKQLIQSIEATLNQDNPRHQAFYVDLWFTMFDGTYKGHG